MGKWVVVVLAVAALAALAGRTLVRALDVCAPYGCTEYGPVGPAPKVGGAEWEDLRPYGNVGSPVNAKHKLLGDA